MKNLLYKELKLSMNVQTWIYCFLVFVLMIPSWPSIVAFIYPLIGSTIIFSLANANRDMLYTALLPVKKKDIVRGKVLLMCFMELFCIIISIPFGFLRLSFMELLPEETIYSDLGFNFALYGLVLMVYGIFNLIIFPWYYKRPDVKRVAPFLVSDVVAFFLLGIILVTFILLPDLSSLVNSFSLQGIIAQMSFFAGGIIVFLVCAFLSDYLGGKAFQKVDI